MSDQDLPYSFDLLCDLKSRDDLVRHYAGVTQELRTLDGLIKDHGIVFTPAELAIISPEPDEAIVPKMG